MELSKAQDHIAYAAPYYSTAPMQTTTPSSDYLYQPLHRTANPKSSRSGQQHSASMTATELDYEQFLNIDSLEYGVFNEASPTSTVMMEFSTDDRSFKSISSTDAIDSEIVPYNSSVFHQSAGLDRSSPDTVLVSQDNMIFYTCKGRLLRSSDNAFGGLLSGSRSNDDVIIEAIPVSEEAAVLHIVLSVVYDLQPGPQFSSFDTLKSAVSACKKYGLSMQDLLSCRTPFADRLLAYAPLHAVELYALAAEHDASDLARTVSSYLLSYPLSNLSDDLAIQMGARYLVRLHGLQTTRKLEFKKLLFSVPECHLPTRSCGSADQKKLHRAWAMSIARLAWRFSPDVPAAEIQQIVIHEELTCAQCRDLCQSRIKDIIKSWTLFGRTI